MNAIVVTVFLGLLPVCAGLNCYLCASGLSGCNDPFDRTNSNVTTTGDISANIYCVKKSITSYFTTRYGSPMCNSSAFILGIGTGCCQTDLCNAAYINYQMPSFLILNSVLLLLLLYKFY